MMVDVSRILVGDRIRKDFGNIEELASDIAKNGLINPPAVTPDLELIAGERRLRAIQHLGWPQIEVNVMTVRDALHQVELEVSENENRKDFTFSEKMQWAKLLKEEYSAKAKERSGRNSDLWDDRPKGSLETREIVANAVSMGSGRQLSRAEYIVGNATPEMIQQLDDGDLSINAAYKKLKEEAEALRLRNEEYIQESAEHAKQQNKLFEAKEKLEQENVVLKRLGDVDLNIEINQSKDRELRQYEQIKNLEKQLSDNNKKIARLEKERETFLKVDGYTQALEDERDMLREQLKAVLNSSIKTNEEDVDTILEALQSNVGRLCEMNIDLGRSDLIALSNSIAKIIQSLAKLCDDLKKRISAMPPTA